MLVDKKTKRPTASHISKQAVRGKATVIPTIDFEQQALTSIAGLVVFHSCLHNSISSDVYGVAFGICSAIAMTVMA